MYAPTLAKFLSNSAARGAQVAARTDDRAGRESRRGHGDQRAHAHQRQEPAAESQQRLVDLAPRQQERIDHGQREQKVERPQPQRPEQHPAHQRPRASADVERLGLLGIDERTGRVARMVAQQRAGQEDGQRQEPEGEQVEFEVAVFEHRRVVNVADGPGTGPFFGSENVFREKGAGRKMDLSPSLPPGGQSFAYPSQNRPFPPRPASVGADGRLLCPPGRGVQNRRAGHNPRNALPGRRPSRGAALRPPGQPLPSPRPEAPRILTRPTVGVTIRTVTKSSRQSCQSR